jgi:RNA polymerase-binding transcription factor DksA
MSDIADEANSHIDRELELRIAAARNPKPEKFDVPDGECLNNCGEPVSDGRKYCCVECREDAEKRGRILKRQRA